MSTPWGSFQGRASQLPSGNNVQSSTSSPGSPLPGIRYAPIAPFGGSAEQGKPPEKRRNNRAW